MWSSTICALECCCFSRLCCWYVCALLLFPNDTHRHAYTGRWYLHILPTSIVFACRTALTHMLQHSLDRAAPMYIFYDCIKPKPVFWQTRMNAKCCLRLSICGQLATSARSIECLRKRAHTGIRRQFATATSKSSPLCLYCNKYNICAW